MDNILEIYHAVIPIAFAIFILLVVWYVVKLILSKIEKPEITKIAYYIFLTFGILGVVIGIFISILSSSLSLGISPLFLFLAWRTKVLLNKSTSKQTEPVVKKHIETLNTKSEKNNYWQTILVKLKQVVRSTYFVPVLLLVLLFGNYFFTFSGFVTYTEVERRGCALLEVIYQQTTEEGRIEQVKGMSKDNQNIVIRYIQQYKADNKRCKPVQQFYFEEALILVAGALFLMRKKIFK